MRHTYVSSNLHLIGGSILTCWKCVLKDCFSIWGAGVADWSSTAVGLDLASGDWVTEELTHTHMQHKHLL